MEKKFETLYGKNSKNIPVQWSIGVTGNDTKGIITTIYGQVNGKMIESNREINSGKNIGKKNETTPFKQAVLEATSKWTKKVKNDGYITFLKIEEDNPSNKKLSSNSEKNNENTNIKLNMIRPMLAQTHEKRKKNITYPCFVQPKLDGIRCISYRDDKNEIHLMSRTGKEFPHLLHIRNALSKIKFTGFLDGELFTTKLDFSVISGLVRKKKLKDDDIQQCSLIQYHIYDTFNLDNLEMPFSERTELINNTIRQNKILIKVKTLLCKNEEFMLSKYNDFIQNNYEGIMIRNKEGVYKIKYRSNDLIKLKPFNDEEYKIVGFKEGTGRDKGCIIWICDNGKGTTFNVRPKGTLEYRKHLFNNGDKYIGKMLTVRYQELQDGIPRFGVGIIIRDYE